MEWLFLYFEHSKYTILVMSVSGQMLCNSYKYDLKICLFCLNCWEILFVVCTWSFSDILIIRKVFVLSVLTAASGSLWCQVSEYSLVWCDIIRCLMWPGWPETPSLTSPGSPCLSAFFISVFVFSSFPVICQLFPFNFTLWLCPSCVWLSFVWVK